MKLLQESVSHIGVDSRSAVGVGTSVISPLNNIPPAPTDVYTKRVFKKKFNERIGPHGNRVSIIDSQKFNHSVYVKKFLGFFIAMIQKL